MTYDSKGNAVEAADILDQRHENTMLNARNNETNQPTPEQLIENFPEPKLRSLIAKISNPRWVVPVLPDQELECLLNYAIELTKAGVDEECEPCMRFYREGLTVSFMKILTDEAVNSWKFNIHNCIFNSCVKFMQLCALHLKRDNSYLLELLNTVLDPDNKFNTFNISRQSATTSLIGLTANLHRTESPGSQTTTLTNPSTVTTIATTATTTATVSTGSGSAITSQSSPTTLVWQTQSSNEDTTAPTPSTSITTETGLWPTPLVDSPICSTRLVIKPSQYQQRANDAAGNIVAPTPATSITTKTTWSPVCSTPLEIKQSPPQQRANDAAKNMVAPRNQTNNGQPNVRRPSVEELIFARSPPEPQHPRGWLVDLINKFGHFGGFDNLLDRFFAGVASMQTTKSLEEQNDAKDANKMTDKTAKSNGIATNRPPNKTNETNNNITLHLIYALVRPFGQCYELLTVRTIEKYFLPMWEIVLQLLNNLSDEELKREAKPEGRNDLINGIIKSARCLTSRLTNQENLIKELEMFRLKMILRLLKISSFNGKMSALNEINKILFSFSYYPRQPQIPMCANEDEIDWLSADKIAKWIKDSNVLGIVLHDSLHQPQYVDKLEKILRFLIKEKALTLSDLDAVWQAQAGKHEAIVKNVHDLLAKLAYDFNTEQLDHLFGCFQASMKSANKHQRERLLELIRRLAEDDKSGVMAHKVLKLFWTLAHSLEIPKEVMEQALTAHVKILDYSCAQERDAQKTIWLAKCVDELKQDNGWVLPALRLIREICCLYDPSTSHVQRMHQSFNRQNVIERLQNDHTLVILVTNSLTTYMDRVRAIVKDQPDAVTETLILDGRYSHKQQIQERLDFLKFVLKDGQLWLCSDQAKQIWQCLAVNAVFPSDREECFRWFGKLMGEEPDLDPGINKDFFENNILQLDPQLLTESGIRCFERFFKAVNSKEEKLKAKSRSYILDDEDLIGKDYLWRVITTGNDVISHKAIQLLKEVSTALGPRLQANIATFHENFIVECCDRLKAYHDNINVLTATIQSDNIQDNADDSKDIKMRHAEAEKMCRVIIMLLEYIIECDRAFTGERVFLPLSRAYRGKHITLYVRIQFPGRQQTEDIEINTHSNEIVASFKRQLLKRIKSAGTNSIKIDFYYTNDNLIEIGDDQNAIGMYNIRDKMLITAKLTPYGPGLSSSPDSSSDSSTGSPLRPCPDMMKPESERQLPGIIIAQKPQYIDFFLRLYQLGIDLNHTLLRDGCRNLLHLLPIDRLTSQKLQQMCNPLSTFDNLVLVTPESMFLHPPFAQVIYNLEVLYALIIPAVEHNQSFQMSWIHSGVAHFILELLTKNNFLPNSDVHTKRAAFTNVLRLSKIFLFVVGCVLSKVGDEPTPNVGESARSQIDLLKSTFTNIVGQSEQTIRSIAVKLADSLSNEMLSYEPEGEVCRKLFDSALKWSCPDIQTIKAIVQLAWASGCGHLDMLDSNNSFSNSKPAPDQTDHNLCKEALEVLTISLVLNPEASDSLSKDPMWSKFILALVLENPMRQIRQSAAEQLYLICTYCATDWRPFSFVIALLIDALENMAPHNANTCAEFFQLLCRTLSYGCLFSWPFPINDVLLTQEISWLRAILDNVKKSGETNVHEDLLEGHLCLTKELMFYFNTDLKSQLTDFIMEILDEFLFPASRQYLQLHQNDQTINFDTPPPVCRSPHTITAACDLLIALCQNSIPNMKLIVNNLVNMICTHSEPLREWEYLPPINTRPFKGFCGLKNAGATCYMNSVLQQLFMVPSIRVGILSASGACNDPHEDFSNEAESISEYYASPEFISMNARDRYNVSILKHVQAIFAHLGHSALQFYVPRGLWSHFKLQGEPVNLREQQDAVEFFMSILDGLDEGLKALGHPQLMAATLGGCFSDQKICKECPHRYSKEEPFSVFSVDIRNHSSLTESLEQYVKGELLEGADAYHCDKCNKKVVTIKRLCVRKLPPVLAIQLKRFEYDYERDCAIKFNDYFEFPRELDMEPYTVSGLAKMEGEVVEYDDILDESQTTTKYQLTGIVVHSGQASGGHYFSYILHKDYETGKDQWYKFDDGEVTECKMHEDEELKAQCFGGDYMGEVFDSNLKRMQFRRQKRWWNAYMLFYTRCDQKFVHKKSIKEQMSLAESRHIILPMPEPIERSVRIQNIRFLHSRSIFTSEFFSFIRKLVHASAPPPARIDKMTPQVEEVSLLGIQLATRFLFHTGFHTKKTLRGTSTDWYDTLCSHLRNSSMVRRWFAEHGLLSTPGRLSEYILVAPTPELRTMFVKLIVFVCHFAINDEPLQSIQTQADSLCEQILLHVLYLLKSDVPENGKHLAQYFALFTMYASLNVQQRQQLLKLNVPAIFMQVALDEGPGPPIKHQYPELCKLHQVVSQLVRCSDITSDCSSPNESSAILPNIYGDPNINAEDRPKLSKEAMQYLFQKTAYIKKVIEDVHVGEEGLKLLQYCCWENPIFSRNVLIELLWQCGFTYWHDLRHHTELLLNILIMEDSWQNHRIHNALLGVAEEREGLLEIIQRTKTHYQKRAYQIMKCLVHLFKNCPCAHEMLLNNAKVTTQWVMACEWLREELERRVSSNQYSYSSWSHSSAAVSSVATNENSNGYMLERSQSAKNLLALAFELCPSDLDAGENEEASDGVLVRLQSQQMLDQIQNDEPAFNERIQTSYTTAGTKDSSESEEDPCESMHTQNDDCGSKTTEFADRGITENLAFNNSDVMEITENHEVPRSPYEDEEDDDDNDTNITDDEYPCENNVREMYGEQIWKDRMAREIWMIKDVKMKAKEERERKVDKDESQSQPVEKLNQQMVNMLISDLNTQDASNKRPVHNKDSESVSSGVQKCDNISGKSNESTTQSSPAVVNPKAEQKQIIKTDLVHE